MRVCNGIYLTYYWVCECLSFLPTYTRLLLWGDDRICSAAESYPPLSDSWRLRTLFFQAGQSLESPVLFLL